MKQPQSKVSLVEKIGYSLGDLAANLVFQTLITYLAFFYTDIYGLKNNDASIIMLSVGLVAAFLFNPIIGAIADRTKSRMRAARSGLDNLGAAASTSASTRG